MNIDHPQSSFWPPTQFAQTVSQWSSEMYQATMHNIQDLAVSVREGLIHEKIQELSTQANETAIKVLNASIPVLKTTAGALLFLSQSSMFVLGGLVGVLAPTFMDSSINRICHVWENLGLFEKTLFATGGIVAFPISMASVAFFVGGHCSLYLQSLKSPDECLSQTD